MHKLTMLLDCNVAQLHMHWYDSWSAKSEHIYTVLSITSEPQAQN